MQQRWKAVWIDQEGKTVEFIFDSIPNRLIARIDCRLKANYARLVPPDSFELEEADYEQYVTPLFGPLPYGRKISES